MRRPRVFTSSDATLFGCPFLEASVEDGDSVVADPPKQPPQPAREHPFVVIVRDDLHPRADAESYTGLDEHVGIGQRMAAVDPGQWSGKVPVQMRIDSAGNVSNEILTFAPRFVVQLETAIDRDPIRVGQMGGKIVRADNGSERQLNPLTIRLTQE